MEECFHSFASFTVSGWTAGSGAHISPRRSHFFASAGHTAPVVLPLRGIPGHAGAGRISPAGSFARVRLLHKLSKILAGTQTIPVSSLRSRFDPTTRKPRVPGTTFAGARTHSQVALIPASQWRYWESMKCCHNAVRVTAPVLTVAGRAAIGN